MLRREKSVCMGCRPSVSCQAMSVAGKSLTSWSGCVVHFPWFVPDIVFTCVAAKHTCMSSCMYLQTLDGMQGRPTLRQPKRIPLHPHLHNRDCRSNADVIEFRIQSSHIPYLWATLRPHKVAWQGWLVWSGWCNVPVFAAFPDGSCSEQLWLGT